MNKKGSRKEFKGTSKESLEKIIDSHRIKPIIIGCGAEGSFLLDLFKHSIDHPLDRGMIALKANEIRDNDISYLLSSESVSSFMAAPDKLGDERLHKKDMDMVMKMVGENNIVILLGSLSDGQGTYLLPLVADSLKGSKKMLLAFSTCTFLNEGMRANEYFDKGLYLCKEKGLKVLNVNIDDISEPKPALPTLLRYRLAANRLVSLVDYLEATVNEIGLVNLTIDDMKTVMGKSGRFFFNGRKGSLADKPTSILNSLLDDSVVDLEIREVNRALCDIRGGEEFTVGMAQEYAMAVSERFPDIEIIWGASIEKGWKEKLEMTLLLSYSV